MRSRPKNFPTEGPRCFLPSNEKSPKPGFSEDSIRNRLQRESYIVPGISRTALSPGKCAVISTVPPIASMTSQSVPTWIPWRRSCFETAAWEIFSALASCFWVMPRALRNSRKEVCRMSSWARCSILSCDSCGRALIISFKDLGIKVAQFCQKLVTQAGFKLHELIQKFIAEYDCPVHNITYRLYVKMLSCLPPKNHAGNLSCISFAKTDVTIAC